MQPNEIVIDNIKKLLSSMGFDAQIFGRMEENRIVFNIKTDNAQLLIGKQGANLEALQYLVRLIVRDQLVENSFLFSLDIDDYKDSRTIHLKEIARRAAHQVRETKKALRLPALPAYERKVVHDYLSLFSDVFSESVGVEPDRRIIIRYQGKNKKDDPFDFIENS